MRKFSFEGRGLGGQQGALEVPKDAHRKRCSAFVKFYSKNKKIDGVSRVEGEIGRWRGSEGERGERRRR